LRQGQCLFTGSQGLVYLALELQDVCQHDQSVDFACGVASGAE
jgi:hypothetical protein